MKEDLDKTLRTDALLDKQQFNNVDYDTSCEQLTELCTNLEQELNAATNRIAKFVSYWQSFCECECVSETPQGSCMYCDLQQLQGIDIKNNRY